MDLASGISNHVLSHWFEDTKWIRKDTRLVQVRTSLCMHVSYTFLSGVLQEETFLESCQCFGVQMGTCSKSLESQAHSCDLVTKI